MGFTVKEQQNFVLLEKFRNFHQSENFKLFRRARETRLLLYTLRCNYRTLLLSISKFHKVVETMGFWDPLSPYLRPNTQKIISKEIFNYLSAASSIIDLSRRYSRMLLSEHQQLSYGQHVKEVFLMSIPHRVIRNLRNYVSHYSLLNIGVNFEKSITGGTKSFFYLSTAELLEWDEWDNEERLFLSGLGKYFEIESLVTQYHIDFMKTQDKFFIEVVKNHLESLKSTYLEMEVLLIEAKAAKMVNSLPFRPSALRYLKRVLCEIDGK